MASNAIVNRQVNIYINSGEAQKALDKLIAKEKILKDELAKATDPKKIKQLNAELAKLSEPIDRATKKIKGELTPSFRDLQQAASRAIAEFKRTGDPAMLAQYHKFNAELQKQKTLIDGINRSQQGLTKKGIFTSAFWANLAAGGIVAAASAIKQFFSSAIDEALDADLSTQRLKGTLENLGRTDAFDRIIRKAQEMADKFKFLDNDEITGVFEKLIDTGRLTEKQMNDLIPVIIDFASKTRMSVGEATDVITQALGGKAGPALKKFGIDLKDAGTETERLNIMMTTLKSKVDGAAEAFGKSMAGQLAISRQEMKNMSEDLGNELIPWINKLGSVALGVVRNLKTFGRAVKEALSGGTGFFAINRDAIVQDPNFKATVEQLTEQRIAAFDAVQKNVEQQLGRKLTKSKADQELLRDVQDKVLQGFLASAKSAQAQIEVLKKDFKNNAEDGQALRTLIESSEASLRAIDEINSRKSKEPLGIIPPKAKDEVDKVTKSVKDLNDELKKFLELSRKTKAELLTELDVEPESNETRRLRELNERLSKSTLGTGTNDRFDAAFRDQEEKNQKLLEQERMFLEAKLNAQKDYLTSIVTVEQFFVDNKTQKENAELEADRQRNDTKKRNLDRQLRGKLISQQQYDREVQKIDKQEEKRRHEIAVRQFKRKQRQDVAEALLNGTLAVLMDLKTIPKVLPGTVIPNPELPAAIILDAVTTAAKVGAALAVKPPEFGGGGKLRGPSHSDNNGMPVTNPKTGEVQAYLEGNEGIINKRTMADNREYQVSGTPSQIASSINRLHGGVGWDSSAIVIPQWRTITPQRMNFPVMKKAYATGGVFQSEANSPQSTEESKQSTQALLSMQMSIERLNSILANGITAYTLLSDLEKQQKRLDDIRRDSTMK